MSELKMWKRMIFGIALANLEELSYYNNRRKYCPEGERDIFLYVVWGIKNLPTLFYWPLRLYASTMGLLCILTKGKTPDSLSPQKRIKMMAQARKFPFFNTLNKLVKAMVLLRLFDQLPLNSNNNNNNNNKLNKIVKNRS